MVFETESFVELDFSSVSRILASSGLQVDSEVEVYNAANKWLSHNMEERCKFAKQLLLKVRLNLLSEQTLKHLINKSSCIFKNEECLKVLKNRDSLYEDNSFIPNNSRHCNQSKFNIMICGGRDRSSNIVGEVREFDVNNLQVKTLPALVDQKERFVAVYCKGEVYVFGGFNTKNLLRSVEKYSPVSKTWNYVCDLPDDRQYFCGCAFMDKIYLFGGDCLNFENLKDSLQFDTKQLKWDQITRKNEGIRNEACSVFEGNIVVCGGINENFLSTNKVESYDVFSDTWTQMPSMIERRSRHNLVNFKSKLFVIGGKDSGIKCEVFDKTSNRFIALKTPELKYLFMKAYLIGSKLFILQHGTNKIICYDVCKNKWSEEQCEVMKNIKYCSTVKIPLY